VADLRASSLTPPMDPLAAAPEIIKLQMDGHEIRRFADAGIQDAVNRAVAGIPEGRKGAVIFDGGRDGIRATAVAKLGDHWSIAMTERRAWDGKFSGEAAAVFSW
jgi:hypothetical protein